MGAFSENKWEADEVGDKLNKQLFKKENKKLRKNRNSKLNDLKTKKLKNDTKKNGKNVKKLHDDQSEIKIDENSKKRSRTSSNIDNTFVNVKKIKSSPEYKQKNIKNNKNNCNINSAEATKNNISTHHQITDKHKKSGLLKSNAIEKKKKREKEKRKKLKNTNAISQKSNEKINIKKIQEMLMMKKNENKNRVNQPETLRDRMMTQLRASRFRYLNETLYNNQSFESRKMFKEDPDAFKAYHTGYRQQVEHWPLNPLDIIISSVKKMPKDYIIADFGCGEARLANSVDQNVKSLDLVAINDNVIACDMAHTPLLLNSCHVVVFCLSLMGTNLTDYLLEANRVLKKDGILKIAEIESRFENVDEFISSLENYGFKNTWKDLSHNLFYFMDFKKTLDIDRKNKKLPSISLKSCLYKKR